MYGEEFAKLIDEKLNADKTSKSSNHQNKQHFGVIKANSEKSKHLETATIKVEGLMIDLVNLRSEQYTEDSRVPIIAIGTPTEDAFRRDLTINSLFYNINEEKVEDLTGKGLSDLREGIIRTPLEPLQTFLDDPLRVLRTIRFANRFEFEIVPEIFAAAKDTNVRDSILNKLSYERLGIELDKMFEGNRPEVSIAKLHEFDILQLLYKIPPESTELSDQEKISSLINLSDNLSQVLGYLFRDFKAQLGTGEKVTFCGREIFSDAKQLKEHQMRCFYTALLIPFYNYQVPQGKKKTTQSVVQYILNNSLKRSNEVQKYVLETCQGVPGHIAFTNELQNNPQAFEADPARRVALGWYLRETGSRQTSIQLLSCVLEYCRGLDRATMLRDTQIDTTKILTILERQ